jgi:protein FAM50
VGLVTIDEMKRTQERVMAERERKLVQMANDKKKEEKNKLKAKEAKKLKDKKKLKTLSFNPDDEEEDEEGDQDSSRDDLKVIIKEMKEKRKSEDGQGEMTSPEASGKRKRFGMNPDVETKFLPDRDRDKEENVLREKLRLEWDRRQREVKEQQIDIIYSYWDGSGHKKTITMIKGNTIYQFLCKVLDTIRNEFPELKTVSGDQLMYVKEDLIIPQTNSFYDFIVTRARGKSGLLFNFDLKEEEVAEEGLHTGKVLSISLVALIMFFL